MPVRTRTYADRLAAGTLPGKIAQLADAEVMGLRAEVERLRAALRELRHSAYTTGPGQVKIDRTLNAS